MGFGSGYDPGNVSTGAVYDANNAGSGLGGGFGLTADPGTLGYSGGGFQGSGWGAVRGGLLGMLGGTPASVALGALAGYYGAPALSSAWDWTRGQLGFGPPPGSTPVGAGMWGSWSPGSGTPAPAPMAAAPNIGAPMLAAPMMAPGMGGWGAMGGGQPGGMYAQALMRQGAERG